TRSKRDWSSDVCSSDLPVFVFEIQKVEDVYRMIHDAGKITSRREAAAVLANNIQKAFHKLPKANNKRIAYVIWQKPYMVVGKDTYIQSLLEELGFVNPFIDAEGRYPVVSADD